MSGKHSANKKNVAQPKATSTVDSTKKVNSTSTTFMKDALRFPGAIILEPPSTGGPTAGRSLNVFLSALERCVAAHQTYKVYAPLIRGGEILADLEETVFDDAIENFIQPLKPLDSDYASANDFRDARIKYSIDMAEFKRKEVIRERNEAKNRASSINHDKMRDNDKMG